MISPDQPSRALAIATGALLTPLVILYVAAAYFLYLALTIRPDGPWDHAAASAAVLSCLLTVVSTAVASMYYTFLVRPERATRLWLVPAQVLGIVAAMRWLTLN
ncbi:hypothetical protein ACWCWD_22685 [Streptomyces sp. NPDC001493]